MKVFFRILVISLFTITQSCSNNNSEVENDLKKENLKGEVVLVKTTTIDPEDVSSSEGFSLVVYNEMGMKTKYFVGQSSKYFSLYESIYDNDRLVLCKTSHNWSTGLENSEDKYSYDLMGKLESKTDQNSTTKFSYNEDGKLFKEVFSMEGLSSTMEYFYSDGKKDSTFYTLNNGGKVSYRTDKFGVNNSIVRRFNSEKTLTDIYYLSNNEKGDCIEELGEEYDNKGNKIKSTTTKYEYNYDENGNWIQKRTIEEGKLKNTEYRTIVYKGGDISSCINEMEKIINSISGSNNSNLSNQDNESNNINSSTYTDQSDRSSNRSSSNSYQKNEKQQQTCSKCQGKGVEVCRKCNGNGMIQCSWCNNTGRKYYQGRYETCSDCNGNMRKNCDRCYGKGNTGSCYTCRGLGYYFK